MTQKSAVTIRPSDFACHAVARRRRFIPSGFDIRASSFISCGLAMESVTRPDKRSRLHVLMVFMFVLGKIKGDRPVGFAVDELLHFGIRAVSNLVRRTLLDNQAVAKH